MFRRKKNISFLNLTKEFHNTNIQDYKLLPITFTLIGVQTIIGLVLSNLFKFINLSNQNTLLYYSTIFLALELLPLAIILIVFGSISTSGRWNILSNLTIFQRWIRIFSKDLKTNWKFILITIVGAIFVQILTNLFTLTVGSWITGETVQLSPSSNTNNIIKALQSNWLIIFTTALIAPIFEETLFRLLIPDTTIFLFSRLGIRHLAVRLFSFALSAFLFAFLHEHSIKLTLIINYMMTAFYFQFLRTKTNSLTSPIFAHAGSNLLLALLTI